MEKLYELVIFGIFIVACVAWGVFIGFGIYFAWKWNWLAGGAMFLFLTLIIVLFILAISRRPRK